MVSRALLLAKVVFLCMCCCTALMPDLGSLIIKLAAGLFAAIWLAEAIRNEK